LKDIAHRIDVSETAFVRDRLHAVLTFLKTTSSCFNPESFDEFCRRRFHFPGKGSGKISRTHGYTLRQDWDGK
jgi:hypothetical protein